MTTLINDIACVILASGASSRFGSPKMGHMLSDGATILEKTMSVYSQVFSKIYVVVKNNESGGSAENAANSVIVDAVEKRGAICIPNSNFSKGLSHSIISGVNFVTPARAWLFALGDMPYVNVKTVAGLASMVANDTIVLPKTHYGNGNPVAFGAKFRSELLALTGDAGAKPLVVRHAEKVDYYECDDLGVHHDIDRPSDILPVGAS
jgi:molybdenum cofactor cytidylyltransferase